MAMALLVLKVVLVRPAACMGTVAVRPARMFKMWLRLFFYRPGACYCSLPVLLVTAPGVIALIIEPLF